MRVNVVLTLIEVGGLLLIIVIGLGALRRRRPTRLGATGVQGGRDAVLAILAGAGLAFYALIGFEDSVNIAEETQGTLSGPTRGPCSAGLAVAGTIYLLVTLVSSMVVPTETLAASTAPLLEVEQVARSASPEGVRGDRAVRARQWRPDQHDHGFAPRLRDGGRGHRARVLGRVALGSSHTAHGDRVHDAHRGWSSILPATSPTLADTTVLLLLCAFTVVNVAVLVLRRDAVDHDHFHAPTIAPIIGAIVCVVLIVDNEAEIFLRAGLLLILGAVLWVLAYASGHRAGSPPAEE